MDEFVLKAKVRHDFGSRACRRLRRNGELPCVVYGGGTVRHISVEKQEFIKLAVKAHSSQVFSLRSDEKDIDGIQAIVKEIQVDYLKKRDPLHVDFQELRSGEKISVSVEVTLQGTPKGVKEEGGTLSVLMHEIDIVCLPKDIPEEIVVDVSELRAGESIHAKDISLPPGVELDCSPEEVIVTVIEPMSEQELEASLAGEEETETEAASEESSAKTKDEAGDKEGDE